MIFKSPVFSQASGSVAGLTFSRNQGGMYVRSRATPTNPNTEAQQAVRDAMREAVFQWSNVLTATQRENWNTYAFNTPTFNRLGEATHKTGQQMFIRGSIPRMQALLSVPTVAPTSFDLGSFSALQSLAADASSSDIEFDFGITDEWVDVNGAALLIFQGRPQNATRIYGKGPYQLATAILGNSVTPPTNPGLFTSLFPLAVGQRVFIKANLSYPDGRYSVDSKYSTIVVA